MGIEIDYNFKIGVGFVSFIFVVVIKVDSKVLESYRGFGSCVRWNLL